MCNAAGVSWRWAARGCVVLTTRVRRWMSGRVSFLSGHRWSTAALSVNRYWTSTSPDGSLRSHHPAALQHKHIRLWLWRGNGAESRWNGSWTTPAPLSGPESHGGASERPERGPGLDFSLCLSVLLLKCLMFAGSRLLLPERCYSDPAAQKQSWRVYL